jgi:hypothetical protein
LAIFCNLATKKKAHKSNKDIFLIFKKNHHILTKKTLKSQDLDSVFMYVTKIKEDSKKDLLVHQESFRLLPINVEDPS